MKYLRDLFVVPIAGLIINGTPAVAQGSAESSQAVELFEQYTERVKRDGYRIRIKAQDENRCLIYIEREGKSEEGHGLLGIKWDERKRWELLFSKREAGRCEFVQGEGVLEQKAPFLGEWRPERPVPVPDNLQVKTLLLLTPGVREEAAAENGIRGEDEL